MNFWPPDEHAWPSAVVLSPRIHMYITHTLSHGAGEEEEEQRSKKENYSTMVFDGEILIDSMRP